MRPRRIRRGEHSCPPVLLAGLVALQCGHGEFAVENNVACTAAHAALAASMRPRRIRRGEPDYPGWIVARHYMLQCGHGEFAVENYRRLLVRTADKKLQCGHGEFAV